MRKLIFVLLLVLPLVAKSQTDKCQLLDPELQDTYVGACLNGLAHGQGIATGINGAWYHGNFVNGEKSGYGVKLYANGDGYAGDWLNDMRHGQGRYEYGDQSPWRGDIYQGQWQQDQRHGTGTYIFFPSGDRFTAQWQSGGTADIGTTTFTRRKRVYEDLAKTIAKPGTKVCSVTTEGASPNNMATADVTAVMGDRIQVFINNDQVLMASPKPELNPRWEVLTDWSLCPQ